jgi:hypothetical protein
MPFSMDFFYLFCNEPVSMTSFRSQKIMNMYCPYDGATWHFWAFGTVDNSGGLFGCSVPAKLCMWWVTLPHFMCCHSNQYVYNSWITAFYGPDYGLNKNYVKEYGESVLLWDFTNLCVLFNEWCHDVLCVSTIFRWKHHPTWSSFYSIHLFVTFTYQNWGGTSTDMPAICGMEKLQ